MTDQSNQAKAVETTETTEAPVAQKLTSTQEIEGLRAVHQFLSTFDRVPGNLTSTWSQVLNTVAAVANSLIAKAEETEQKTDG